MSKPSALAVIALISLTVIVVVERGIGAAPLQTQSPCGPGFNAIVCENLLAGAPSSEWDLPGGVADATILGFATTMSVDRGQTVRFKVKSTASSYRLDIYRIGYYDGMGARKVATVAASVTLPQTQPACLNDTTTGLIDCGNWAESASWAVPSTATSGVYIAKLVRPDTGGASHIIFIVRDDGGGSELLVQTSDTTWQAYNPYGGNSLYTGSPAGRAYKVSYNRPFSGRETSGGPQESNFFSNEYPMVRWLEANGFDVSYSSGIDTESRGANIRLHKVFLSVGHDEYWSAGQRANVEAARNAGVNLAFFSGNEMFWKTRWENDAAGTPFRTLVCYKETAADAKIDPTATWTGTWRDPRFSPPADGGRPENAVSGPFFMVNGPRNDAITVLEREGKLRFWRNTTIATLAPGQTATLPTGVLGYEWDEDVDNPTRPAGVIRMSSTTLDVTPKYLLNYGSVYGAGTATHHLTLYRHSSGALVFGAGTIQWAWGLDGIHDRAGTTTDVRMQQATVNLFADMGAQPRSLRAGLVQASASTDALAPTSTIATPVNGATVQSGTPVTITGTASDDGGGLVAGVEISVDGGTTWHPATGTTSWSYGWTPFTSGSTTGSATLISRAIDDSGNLQTSTTGVTVSIQPGPGLVAAYGFEEASGTVAGDRSGNNNNGTITGASWTGSGRFGGALSFNGTTNWVTANDAPSLRLTTTMTLEAWVFPTALSGWRSVLMKERGASGLSYALYANDNVPRPAAYLTVGTTDATVAGVVQVPLNAWTHLAATYDAASLKLYVNGVQVSSTPATGTIAVAASPLRIGGNGVWGEYFQGVVDEVRIYGRVLNASEIQVDMSTPVGGTPLPDTTPPTVSLTAPAAGANVKGAIPVSANAADNVGVAGVQFLLDGASLGAEDQSSPYSISWDTTSVADGTHVLAARARDAAGNTTVSSNVTITVGNIPDTTLPTVSMTAPAAGATVTGTTTVSANASDNVGVAGVQFLLDGAALGAEDVSAPYSIAWDSASTPNGAHVLSARARDAAGNQATSAGVSVNVSNVAPPPGLVAAYAFSEGSGTTAGDRSGNGRTGTITGAAWTAAGRFGSALSFNGTSDWVTVADANALDLTTGMTLEAWVNPAVLSGWRTVIMKERTGGIAYSLYGHDNAPRPAVTVTLTGTVEQSTPGVAQLAIGTWTHLAATYDGATLRLYVNGAQVNSRAVTGAMLTSTSPLRIGGNGVWGEFFQGLIDEVRVFDRARTQAEIQSDMNTPVDPASADSQPPTAPGNLTATGGLATASLAWNASTDNMGVTNYNVHRSTTSGFTATPANRIASPTATSYVDAGLPAATYFYLVTAQDLAGNISPPSTQASAVVTSDTTAPTVSLTAPAAGSTVSSNVTVSANASDNVAVAGVQFLLDDVSLGAEDTTSPYSIAWDTRTAANGAHTLKARARDASGNPTTSAGVGVTVSNTELPGLVAAYGFNAGTGTVTADASANANNGTISGATWNATGRFGKALSFNGASDWVTVADAAPLDLTTGMTLEAWVNPSVLSGWRSTMVKESPGGLSYGLYAHDNAPHPAVSVHTTVDQFAIGTSAIPLNTWTHLAATYDGTTLRLFVNGVQVGSSPLTGSLLQSSGVLRIGGNSVWGEYFSGLIDEVRIYNRALSQAEIQSDMTVPVGG